MNIEEIALRVAEEIGAVAYSPPPMRAVRGYSFTFEQLEAFANALLAELRKDAVPTCLVSDIGVIQNITDCPLEPGLMLFTLPANTEAAIAAAYEQGKREAVPEGLFIIDGGFKRNGTEATPTLLIGFNDNDYDARDSFRNWLRDAAAPKQEK